MTSESNPNQIRNPLRVWLVLPALNEEASLPPLVERIEQAMFEAGLAFRIVFVNDGSTDSTGQIMAEVADRLGAVVVTHPTNLGLGAAIRDGIVTAAAQAEPRDIIVTLDADNTHTPDLILRMVRLVREGHDIVIASRYRSGSRTRGVPVSRRFLSWIASMLLRVWFPTPGVRDYTSGYRAYRAEILQRVVADNGPEFFDQDGFQVMIDILLKLRRSGDLIFGEVPLILRYDLKSGASKMDVGATIVSTLGLIVRRRVGL